MRMNAGGYILLFCLTWYHVVVGGMTACGCNIELKIIMIFAIEL